MMMRSIADLIEEMEDTATECIVDDKKLKGYVLAALSGFIDGALYGCTCLGIGLFVLSINAIICNKKNNK